MLAPSLCHFYSMLSCYECCLYHSATFTLCCLVMNVGSIFLLLLLYVVLLCMLAPSLCYFYSMLSCYECWLHHSATFTLCCLVMNVGSITLPLLLYVVLL